MNKIAPRTPCIRIFDPDSWNSDPSVVEKCNCYNYALGLKEWINDYGLIPGELAGIPPTRPTEENWYELVSADLNALGWKHRRLNSPNEKCPNEYIVAFMTCFGCWHCALKDNAGKWSSKPNLGKEVQEIHYLEHGLMEAEVDDHYYYIVHGYVAITV